MPTIYDVDPNAFVTATAEEMKKIEQIKPPAWAGFVKTGVFKERAPAQDDWWYMRSASVLRKIHSRGPIGVSKLRTLYGGKKNMGVAQEHVFRASGNIIRKVLQQLEAAGLAKQDIKGVKKGRVVTPKGLSFLNSVAKGLAKEESKTAKTTEQAPSTQKPSEKEESKSKTSVQQTKDKSEEKQEPKNSEKKEAK